MIIFQNSFLLYLRYSQSIFFMKDKSLFLLSSIILFFTMLFSGQITWSQDAYGFNAMDCLFYSLVLATTSCFILPKVHKNLMYDTFNVSLKRLYQISFIISLILVAFLYYVTWSDLTESTYDLQNGLWHTTYHKTYFSHDHVPHYFFQPFVGYIGILIAAITYLSVTYCIKTRQPKKILILIIPLIFYIILIVIHSLYISKPEWLG